MATEVERKLEDATRKAAEAKAAYERQQKKVRDLTIAGQLEHDATYQKLYRQLLASKDALHRHRLKMGRKRFSIACTKKKLELAESLLAKMAEPEAKLMSATAAIEQAVEDHKSKVASKVPSEKATR